MKSAPFRKRLIITVLALAGLSAVAGGMIFFKPSNTASAAATAPRAAPVSVATVEEREVTLWDEFSGRLEAIERVDVRSRVAGAVQSVHFREGAIVRQNELLVTIDPAPY